MATIPGHWIHMVGIAGAGMSGIARILFEQGFKVTGSDLQINGTAQRLREMGIEVYEGHSSSNLKEGVDLLVVSSAIPEDNPEVNLALKRNIPVLKRGQMLACMVNNKKGIAVAGAHGKTTTTSMIYWVLRGCGIEPTFIVGGELQDGHINARLGNSDYFVVEADESDASFLEIFPYVAVVTNIEDDHLDFYGSIDNIKKAFVQFINQVRPEGFAVICGEDKYIADIKHDISVRTITYGENSNHDYYIKNWHPKELGSVFEAYRKDVYLGQVELSVPGKHNALNAIAAIAVALELGMDFAKAREEIKKFSGAKRRFQIKGEKFGIMVVDDYAHHPTEIRATLAAAQNLKRERVIAIFQPHRYSRTYKLWRELGEAFSACDLAIFTEVYAASEKPIPGVDGKLVYEAALGTGCNAVYLDSFKRIKKYLLENTRAGDLVLTIGAGDVWKIGEEFLSELESLAVKGIS
ncbi:UDP-N-acetylmuramate--L-alanine ligase [Thermosyntropha lipolytica DSM 11003]|uniref:UDP-N-acetylmuramate--L-alanine ligase n=1 Tax=Thermosyntropha lipolytica DSM 11003 TaxID=1123382 RepID=A0A1M5NZJ9_9FIRM|nr:UDP-N-acetylmuramate--L-alanine ligase [Thermosyntropha lipolytica]SHG94393.1 UDP-N-acetylmuramate--L-alanine ligase [Thermosyntropha lipolytica DSM 11003]